MGMLHTLGMFFVCGCFVFGLFIHSFIYLFFGGWGLTCMYCTVYLDRYLAFYVRYFHDLFAPSHKNPVVTRRVFGSF